MNTITNKDFTFQTFKEYCQEMVKFNEFDFNCVRIKTTYKDGSIISVPSKTFEDYKKYIDRLEENSNVKSYEVYPVKHWFEREFYL